MTGTPKENNLAVIDDFEFLAKEYANLLIASEMDEETQKSLIDALPHMELEEIVDLIGILEAKYVVGETIDLDSKLNKQLEGVTEDFIKKESEIDEETIKQLEALADSIE